MGIAERQDRELRARQTVNRAIPEILRSSPRAKHGVSQSELIVDPNPVIKTPTGAAQTSSVYRPDLKIRVVQDDSLTVAAALSERPFGANRSAKHGKTTDAPPNVTVHNMASMTVRSGGFLEGSNGQEEFLCARSTLYASLYDEHYPLPTLGGIYTPDCLVFRDKHGIDLPRRHRYYINVISAGLTRHPDQRGRYDEREASCSCGVSYCDTHRDLIMQKMKSILRIAQAKGTKKLILGAWGVSKSMNHPLEEVAKLWRKVIAGGLRQRRPNAEQWEGIDEIIFTMVDWRHRQAFEKAFEGTLTNKPLVSDENITHPNSQSMTPDVHMERLLRKAQYLELRIEEARTAFAKQRMREELYKLNHEVALGRAAKAHRDDEAIFDNEEVEDEFVVAGYPASDDDCNAYYPHSFDGTTSDSQGSDDASSETYEFKFGSAGISDSTASQDEEDEMDGHVWVGSVPSPQFDPQTGWFHGSIDQLHSHISGNRIKNESISPRSPLVRLDSNSLDEESPVNGFLTRFQRSDMVDQS